MPAVVIRLLGEDDKPADRQMVFDVVQPDILNNGDGHE